MKVAKISRWPVDPPTVPNVFRRYLDEVSPLGLPLGSDRLEGDKAALERKDAELRRFNTEYEASVMAACWQIVETFGASSQHEADVNSAASVPSAVPFVCGRRR
jgi:hypothetical protein